MNDNLPNNWLGRIIKNPALGAALIAQAAYSYYEKTEQVRGIDHFRAMLLLPMLFHAPTVTAVHGMKKKSGLDKAVLENKGIIVGLEDRVADTLPLTFGAIQIGSDTNLFRVDKFENSFELIPQQKKFPVPVQSQSEKIRHMFQAADRLGYWFDLDITSLYKMLKVRI